jgi:hypothetical protein
MEVTKIMKQLTSEAIIQISKKENQKFDVEKATKYFQETAKEKFKEIYLEVKKDMAAADFMKGLDRKKPVMHELVKSAMNISMTHGCTMYGKEIFEHSKI